MRLRGFAWRLALVVGCFLVAITASSYIVTPSTVLVDPATNIQSALNAYATTGGTVYLGPGTFDLSSTLTFPDSVAINLVGSGRGATILRFIGADNDSDCVKIRGSNSSIQNLSINGHQVAGNGRGVFIGSPTQVIANIQLRNLDIYSTAGKAVYVSGSETGAYLYGKIAFGVVVEDCYLRLNQSGGATDGSSATSLAFVGAGSTTVRFNRTTFTTFLGNAMVAQMGTAGSDLTFDHCVFEDAQQDVQWVLLSHCRHVSFNDCYFEDHWNVGTLGALSNYKIDIRNQCSGVSITNANVDLHYGLDAHFVNVGAAGTATDGVRITNCWVEAQADPSPGTSAIAVGAGTVDSSSVIITGGGARNQDGATVYKWSALASGPYRYSN